MSNLRRHILDCWPGGADLLKAVQDIGNWGEAREKVVKSILTTGTITAHFKWKQGAITYRNRPFTCAETRTEIVKWVCECTRPFKIVKDPGFLVLMKTGRPNYYIPSPSTVAHDVKEVFAWTRNRIAKMLQVSKTLERRERG